MSEEQKHEHHDGKHEHHEAHKQEHVYMEHHEHAKNKAFKISTWILAGVSIVLLVLFVISLAGGFGTSGSNGTGKLKILPSSDVRLKVDTYLKSALSGQTYTLGPFTDAGDMYQFTVTVAGKDFVSYARKDGSILFASGIDLTQPVTPAAAQAQQATVVPKTAKPTVELFVMSYCPYGTQSEKGILPAIRTLGDKVDFKVRFVDYSMHGEKEVLQNLEQYCIETEQSDKYLAYLACFLNDSAGQGSDAAIAACEKSTGVDTTKLAACKTSADTQFNVMKDYNDKASWLSGQFPKVEFDQALNTKYGVQGSPTLVINGVQSNAGRDSASYLSGICAAFDNAPAECLTNLSTTQPGPGFGYDSVGAANAAGCGV